MQGLSLWDAGRIAEYAEARAWADYFMAAPDGLASRMGLEVVEVAGATLLMAPGVDDPFYNRVIGLGIEQPVHPELVDEVIDRFYQRDIYGFWFQMMDAVRPHEALSWLEARGFTPNGAQVKAIRDTSMPPFIETGLDVRQIGPARGGDFADVVVEAFGVPEYFRGMLAGMVGRPGWRHYLASDKDDPVACAAMHIWMDIAWLGFTGTRAAYRGRGAQNALITRRIFDARQAGCRWVVCETWEHQSHQPNRSLLNLQRLGFEIAYWRVNFVP